MGVEALTQALDGSLHLAETDADSAVWVSASSTRNHVLDAMLVDWLGVHGEAKGAATAVW